MTRHSISRRNSVKKIQRHAQWGRDRVSRRTYDHTPHSPWPLFFIELFCSYISLSFFKIFSIGSYKMPHLQTFQYLGAFHLAPLISIQNSLSPYTYKTPMTMQRDVKLNIFNSISIFHAWHKFMLVYWFSPRGSPASFLWGGGGGVFRPSPV